VTEVTEDNGTV